MAVHIMSSQSLIYTFQKLRMKPIDKNKNRIEIQKQKSNVKKRINNVRQNKA